MAMLGGVLEGVVVDVLEEVITRRRYLRGTRRGHLQVFRELIRDRD